MQALKLTGNILSLSDDATPDIDLSVYLDDTDTDEQTLSIDGYDLTIENGNVVNIRPEIIAFRVYTAGSGTTSFGVGEHNIIFEVEKLDSVNVFNVFTGEFEVPTGGDGLYRFDLFYQYNSNQTVGIYIDNILFENATLLGNAYCNYNSIIYLTQGKKVRVKLNTTVGFFPLPAYFSGYRIH